MTTDSNVLAVNAGLRAAVGDYRLVAEIGRGGMANVFLALCPNADGTSRPVVLKQLQPALAHEDEFRTMFENEARLATRFRHANVVETYDIDSDRDLCVLVMEFLHGQTLSQIRQRAGQGSQVPFSIHLRVLADALAGLHYVHELTDDDGTPLGIVHRDVTPSNIFVTYDGQVKVVDFGIAQASIGHTETRLGGLKGKLAYMSPEAVRRERVDRRSDIFSVGVMLWEAATGRRLWEQHDEVEVYGRLAAGDLPIQTAGAQGTSNDMLRIAERALAVDPSDRYPTAEEMRQDVEDVLVRLGKTTPMAGLAAYMEAFFSLEREQFQAVVDEALARVSSEAISESRSLQNEVSDSYPGVDHSEHPTPMYSPTASSVTFRPTTTSYELVDSSKAPPFHSGLRRGFGVASVAAAAALGVAFAAHSPIGAPAAAEGTTVTAKPTATYDEELKKVTDTAPAPLPARPASQAPPVAPEPASGSPALARGTIFVALVARPAHARLFLDGVPLEGNPAGLRIQPDDKRHQLRIEAAGYAPLVRTIDLDRDVAKEFELAPSTGPRDELPKPRHDRPAMAREDPWGI
jgi:eukaryotic-like serine/threonine-protein kinase